MLSAAVELVIAVCHAPIRTRAGGHGKGGAGPSRGKHGSGGCACIGGGTEGAPAVRRKAMPNVLQQAIDADDGDREPRSSKTGSGSNSDD